MRILYIDESGVSNSEHEPFLVVAGVLLDGDQHWQAIERHLKSIMRRRLPEEMHVTGIFHSKDIWHGAKRFQRDVWSREKRMQILEDLSEIPKLFHLPLFASSISRKDAGNWFRRKLNDATEKRDEELTLLTHANAFVHLIAAVDSWMKHNAPREVAMIVAEEAGATNGAIKLLQDGYRHDEIDEYFRPFPDAAFKTNCIIDTVHFASKKHSPILQIADLCAFIFKRQLQNCKHSKNLFKQLQSQLVEQLPTYWTGDSPKYVKVTVPRKSAKLIEE